MTTERSEKTTFVDLRPAQFRLVSENITSTVLTSATDENKTEVKNETSVGFRVGLDNLDNPSSIQVEMDYKVTIFVDGTGEKLVDYSAKYESIFDIFNYVGVEDWAKVPNDTFAPYFAMLHQQAVQRVEQTLLAAGFKNIPIPRVQSFDIATQ